MKLEFTKMHGCGNDYIYVFGDVPENAADLSIRLSDRHRGVGSDGMIYISPSDSADFRMRIFNADGSEAKMCGNGIRCVGKYLYDKGFTDKTQLDIETLSGIRSLKMKAESGKVQRVTVDMGRAEVGDDTAVKAHGFTVTGTPVSVGNPHFVIFADDTEETDICEMGPLIGKTEAFPDGVNVEFVRLTGKDRIRMRVWERGSGITLACGTGACASAAAAVRKGYCSADSRILVELDGGELEISFDSDSGRCFMTGEAVEVFSGAIDIPVDRG